MELYIILGVVALVFIYLLATYNSFVKLNNSTKEAFSTMDVYLKKRWDLIPNLVEIVKGYAKHEKETLSEIVNLRNGVYEKMSENEKLKTNEQLTQGVLKVMALAESYPDLKANANFIELSKQLTSVEGEIANSRKYYNANVREFNNKVEFFPSNIIAKLFNYKSKLFFEVNVAERENVNVKM